MGATKPIVTRTECELKWPHVPGVLAFVESHAVITGVPSSKKVTCRTFYLMHRAADAAQRSQTTRFAIFCKFEVSAMLLMQATVRAACLTEYCRLIKANARHFESVYDSVAEIREYQTMPASEAIPHHILGILKLFSVLLYNRAGSQLLSKRSLLEHKNR